MPKYPDDHDADELDDRHDRDDDRHDHDDDRDREDRRYRESSPGTGSGGKVFLALVGCGCLMVLGCAGVITVGVVWGWNLFTQHLAEPTSAAEQFLDQLQHGQVDAAYEMTAQDFRQRNTPQQFADFVKQFPILTTHTSRSLKLAQVNSNPAGTRASIVMTLHSQNNATTCTLVLIEEGGAWKVDGVTVP